MENSNRMEILLVGRDTATAGLKNNLKQVEKQGLMTGKSLGASFKAMQMQFIAAAAAMAGVVSVLKKCVDASAEFELTVKKLSVSVENAGFVWKYFERELLDFADSMQEMTIYGNTETLKLLQDLLPYTNDVGKAMTGAKLAMDMAAAGLFDVGTASKYIGMAMQGNVEMLGRYVGELRSNSNALLKNMTAAEKTTYALDLLKDKYGGMAESEVKTFTGGVKQAGNAVGDLARESGNLITKSDGVRGFFNAVRGVASTFAFLIHESQIDVGAELYEQAQLAMKALTEGINVELLKEQESFWSAKADITANGDKVITDILTQFSAEKAEITLQDKLFFVQNEKEKIQTLMETNRLDLEMQEKLSAQKMKLQMAEIKIQKKLDLERIKLAGTTTASLLGSLADGFELAQGESKKFAGAIKAIRLSEAVINTAMAVTSGLATQPFVPVGLAMGAMAAAEGAIQIATIASQGFSQGTDSVPSMLTPGEIVVPRTFADAVRAGDISIGGRGGGGSTYTFHFEIHNPTIISDGGIEEFERQLTEKISSSIASEAERIQ